jgi:hypothetical protein
MLNQTDLARGHSGHSIPIDLRIDDNSFLLRWQKGRRAIWRATAHHLQAEGAPSPPFQVLPLRVVLLPTAARDPLHVLPLLSLTLYASP